MRFNQINNLSQYLKHHSPRVFLSFQHFVKRYCRRQDTSLDMIIAATSRQGHTHPQASGSLQVKPLSCCRGDVSLNMLNRQKCQHCDEISSTWFGFHHSNSANAPSRRFFLQHVLNMSASLYKRAMPKTISSWLVATLLAPRC